MRTIIKWTMAVLLLILSVVLVIFLPEYITKKNDSSYMNQYRLYSQESSVTVNMDLTMDEKLEILSGDALGEERISVIQLDKVRDLEENDEKLLPELKKQLEIMEKAELLPIYSEGMDLNALFESAELYACTLKSKPGKIFYVWNIQFYSNTGEESYTFQVDTVTYQIYEAIVNSDQAVKYMQKILERSEEENYSLLAEWSLKYEEYLSCQKPSEGSTGDGEMENRLGYFDIAGEEDGFWMNSLLFGQKANYEIQCNSYMAYTDNDKKIEGNFYFQIVSDDEINEMGLDSESASDNDTGK